MITVLTLHVTLIYYVPGAVTATCVCSLLSFNAALPWYQEVACPPEQDATPGI